MRIGTLDAITIRLQKNDFCIVEQGCPSSPQWQKSTPVQPTMQQQKIEAIAGTFQPDSDKKP